MTMKDFIETPRRPSTPLSNRLRNTMEVSEEMKKSIALLELLTSRQIGYQFKLDILDSSDLEEYNNCMNLRRSGVVYDTYFSDNCLDLKEREEFFLHRLEITRKCGLILAGKIFDPKKQTWDIISVALFVTPSSLLPLFDTKETPCPQFPKSLRRLYQKITTLYGRSGLLDLQDDQEPFVCVGSMTESCFTSAFVSRCLLLFWSVCAQRMKKETTFFEMGCSTTLYTNLQNLEKVMELKDDCVSALSQDASVDNKKCTLALAEVRTNQVLRRLDFLAEKHAKLAKK
mmetsp:Transcript_28332/g.32452  ORF Transcript_28332/g.32452 Transcript_28332/m.32452 type:complete len:286 (+) Transcript_28332:54-911(+)